MSTRRGYAVAFLSDVRIGPEILRYIEQIEATFEPFGGEWVVHGSQPEIAEGDWRGDLVVIGFPSIVAARDWYASPAYQEILELRSRHSDSVALLVEGVRDGYRAEETLHKLRTG